MTATITNLPTAGANPRANPAAPAGRDGWHGLDVSKTAGLDPQSAKDRRKATRLMTGDLAVAARLLYGAVATCRRVVGDQDQADAIERVRADLVAVLAGEDTPSEIRYGDLAADASAYADEVETLREELETARGPRVHGKGN